MHSDTKATEWDREYTIRPYHFLVPNIIFLTIGTLFLMGLIVYGVSSHDRVAFIYSMFFPVPVIGECVLIGILIRRYLLAFTVSADGISVTRGKREILPHSHWTDFHKAYFFTDYRKKIYFVLTQEDLLPGQRKYLMEKLADDLPKAVQHPYIAFRLTSEMVELVEHCIAGKIPIEKYAQ